MCRLRLVRNRRTPRVTRNAGEKLHGIKFSYSLQKDAYADLEFMNDVGGPAFKCLDNIQCVVRPHKGHLMLSLVSRLRLLARRHCHEQGWQLHQPS